MVAYKENKEQILKRLRRIEGQVRGIQKMVEDDKYCIDILTQVSSVSAATQKVGLIVLQDHMNGCIKQALKSGKGQEKVDEVISAVDRFIKS